jgi:hypothetical protein
MVPPQVFPARPPYSDEAPVRGFQMQGMWMAECGPARPGLPRRWICLTTEEALFAGSGEYHEDGSVGADEEGVVGG